MALPLVGSDIVHLDKNTFMWVQMTHFVINVDQDDAALIASLIASPEYAHDYASPFPSHGAPFGKTIHGRWVLSAISVDRFGPSTADRAVVELQRWANEQDWVDPDFRQPPEVMHRLQSVCSLLRSGNVYKLLNPGREAEHDYGDVTGGLGFHEFVVIDRTNGTLHLVVASDD
jgi:hypothetical protein